MKNNKFTMSDFSKEFENAKHEEESINEFEEVCDECAISTDEEIDVEPVPKIVECELSGCTRLNLREKPDIESDVLLIANRNWVLLVDENYKDTVWSRVLGYREKDKPKETTVALGYYCMTMYINAV